MKRKLVEHDKYDQREVTSSQMPLQECIISRGRQTRNFENIYENRSKQVSCTGLPHIKTVDDFLNLHINWLRLTASKSHGKTCVMVFQIGEHNWFSIHLTHLPNLLKIELWSYQKFVVWLFSRPDTVCTNPAHIYIVTFCILQNAECICVDLYCIYVD